jgi:diacylglycerol kinase (ATP)
MVFIVNGKSRSGARLGDQARESLEAEGFAVREFRRPSSPREFNALLDRYIAKGEPLIAVGGGDGTQRMAAEKIAGTASAMAVFPLGTGNAWAKDLGIPVGVSETAKALANAQIEPIDLGIANGRGFVNVATIGFSSLIVKNLPAGLKGKFGKLVYLPAVVRSLRELRPFRLKISTEYDGYDGMALQFVAASGRTHAGPFRVTRMASNNDGLLSLYVLDDTDRTGLVKFGLGLLTGTHTYLDEVWSCESATTKVSTDPTKRIIVDGEPSGTTPLALSIRPKALRVMVPVPEAGQTDVSSPSEPA